MGGPFPLPPSPYSLFLDFNACPLQPYPSCSPPLSPFLHPFPLHSSYPLALPLNGRGSKFFEFYSAVGDFKPIVRKRKRVSHNGFCHKNIINCNTKQCKCCRLPVSGFGYGGGKSLHVWRRFARFGLLPVWRAPEKKMFVYIAICDDPRQTSIPITKSVEEF